MEMSESVFSTSRLLTLAGGRLTEMLESGISTPAVSEPAYHNQLVHYNVFTSVHHTRWGDREGDSQGHQGSEGKVLGKHVDCLEDGSKLIVLSI